jgi:glycosyltransferase involved in cell wall biosynthesis
VTTVSVVVPTRGGARRLPLLLASLRRQTHPSWEAVVVVDGDIDGSEQVVARLAGDLPVRTLVLPENRGRSAALNAGFGAASGDVLLRSDDDLELGDEHLARHAAHHDAAEGPIGVVGLCRNVFATGPYARAYGERADRRFRRAAYASPADQAWRYWAANVSVTADTWRRVGEYDLSYRGYGWEDVDWGYRLHRAGVPISVEPDVEARHHGAAATTADRALRAYYSGAARQHFVEQHADDGVEALMPSPSAGHGWWGAAVAGSARLATEDRLAGLGRAVDRVVPFVPVPVAEKLVAVLVEGAALAGHGAGRTEGRI